MKKHFGDRKIVFIVGAMADKDVKGMMSMLVPLADSFIALKPNNPRAMEAEKLAKLLSQLGAKAESAPTCSSGVKRALDRAGKEGVVACLGSLYFSGEIRFAYENIMGECYE